MRRPGQGSGAPPRGTRPCAGAPPGLQAAQAHLQGRRWELPRFPLSHTDMGGHSPGSWRPWVWSGAWKAQGPAGVSGSRGPHGQVRRSAGSRQPMGRAAPLRAEARLSGRAPARDGPSWALPRKHVGWKLSWLCSAGWLAGPRERGMGEGGFGLPSCPQLPRLSLVLAARRASRACGTRARNWQPDTKGPIQRPQVSVWTEGAGGAGLPRKAPGGSSWTARAFRAPSWLQSSGPASVFSWLCVQAPLFLPGHQPT